MSSSSKSSSRVTLKKKVVAQRGLEFQLLKHATTLIHFDAVNVVLFSDDRMKFYESFSLFYRTRQTRPTRPTRYLIYSSLFSNLSMMHGGSLQMVCVLNDESNLTFFRLFVNSLIVRSSLVVGLTVVVMVVHARCCLLIMSWAFLLIAWILWLNRQTRTRQTRTNRWLFRQLFMNVLCLTIGVWENDCQTTYFIDHVWLSNLSVNLSVNNKSSCQWLLNLHDYVSLETFLGGCYLIVPLVVKRRLLLIRTPRSW